MCKVNWKILLISVLIVLLNCGFVEGVSIYSDNFDDYDTGAINDSGATANGWRAANISSTSTTNIVSSNNSSWDGSSGQSVASVRNGGSINPILFNDFENSIGGNLTSADGILGFSWDFSASNTADRPGFHISSGTLWNSPSIISLDVGYSGGFKLRYYDGATAITINELYLANEWYRAVVSNVDMNAQKYDLDVLRWDGGNQTSVISVDGLAFKSAATELQSVRFLTSGSATSYQNYLDNFQVVPEPATLVLLGLGGLMIRRKK